MAMNKVAALAVLIAVMATSGCSRSGAGEQPPVPDWKDPIGGVPVASAGAAQHRVPFRVHLMPGPRPYRILLTPHRPPAATVVILQYQTPSGLTDIYEEQPQVTATKFRQVIAHWVALNGKPGTSGTATEITLQGGYPALMTTTADGKRSEIEWIEAGVDYHILGPSLSRRDCVQLASTLADENPSPPLPRSGAASNNAAMASAALAS